MRTTLGDSVLDDIYNLPTQRWILAGGFTSYMLDYINSFSDIDIFVFDGIVPCPQKWHKWTTYCGNYDVYRHVHSKVSIDLIIATEWDKEPLMDCMYNLLDGFDHVICKKAIHLLSNLVLDIPFGSTTFATTARERKYIGRIKKLVHEPDLLLSQTENKATTDLTLLYSYLNAIDY